MVLLNQIGKEKTPSLTVIIPARNEERNIGKLLHSLVVQPIEIEIIVVNDGSSDRTKEVAQQFNVIIIDNDILPIGWLGKSWACWKGAMAANGELLLFVDCDTWFEGNGVLKLMNTYTSDNKRSVISIQPYHYMESWKEKFSAIFHLIVVASTQGSALYTSVVKGGFGQCLLCSREEYFLYGGHQSIKGEVVENLAFVQKVAAEGKEVKVFLGKGIINMRMYDEHWRNIINGWAKSIFKGAKTVSRGTLILIVLWVASLYSVLISMNSWYYFMYVGLLYYVLRNIGNMTIWDTLLWPLHFFFFLGVFVYSFIQNVFFKRSIWKGRNILK